MESVDNTLEYSDPLLYDAENTQFEPDGLFYLALAQRFGGPVLELGCGTGRFTIPLADQGIAITGLDISAPMLTQARQKVGAHAVSWVLADARTFQLAQQFRFIFESGATFQHMLTRADQAAFLACIVQHLAPNGYAVVGTLLPTPALLKTNLAEQEWFNYRAMDGRMVRVTGTDAYDPIQQVRTEIAYRRWTAPDGQEIVQFAPLQLRYTFPQEMETLLSMNGLTVVERFGDFDFSPLTQQSTYLLYVCQKAAG